MHCLEYSHLVHDRTSMGLERKETHGMASLVKFASLIGTKHFTSERLAQACFRITAIVTAFAIPKL
jgi:hypothetical protein